MHSPFASDARFLPGLPFVMLTLLMGVLWVAGGASNASVAGQTIVRAAAVLAIVVAILIGDRRSYRRWGAAGWILGGALALTLLQLVPLPPALWQALPGRDLFAQAATVSGQPQPWRPWSIVPSATANAAASLLVPAAVLALVGLLTERERQWLPTLALVLVMSAMLLGMLQFSGARIDNPLINDTVGEVGAVFANRNHFALLLAMGCLIAPVWATIPGMTLWRILAALACVILLSLMILATGSRAGMLLGIVALTIGTIMVQRSVRRLFRGSPRWLLPTVGAAFAGSIILVGFLSFAADRAVSIDRAMTIDARMDIRSRAAPTVLRMVESYFPAGSGLGGFDPMFRIHEPTQLLKPTFFNHAHNDYLEIALDAGLPGLLILGAAMAWWAWATIEAWRGPMGSMNFLARLGSAMLGLVLVASLFDYPARTPLIMAMMVVAAIWLGDRQRPTRSALPHPKQHL